MKSATAIIKQVKDEIEIVFFGGWVVQSYEPGLEAICTSQIMDWWAARELCRSCRIERAMQLAGNPNFVYLADEWIRMSWIEVVRYAIKEMRA